MHCSPPAKSDLVPLRHPVTFWSHRSVPKMTERGGTWLLFRVQNRFDQIVCDHVSPDLRTAVPPSFDKTMIMFRHRLPGTSCSQIESSDFSLKWAILNQQQNNDRALEICGMFSGVLDKENAETSTTQLLVWKVVSLCNYSCCEQSAAVDLPVPRTER